MVYLDLTRTSSNRSGYVHCKHRWANCYLL